MKPEGETIGGHEILEELGRGGMAVVFRALETDSGREVALKILDPGHSLRPGIIGRFRQEIALLAAVDHPGILPLYDSGEHEGRPWYSMKLASGGSLSDNLADLCGKPREAARLCAGAARAVHHAHTHGILHRDLKPGNILLLEDGRFSVADFGLARWIDSGVNLTRTADILGSPEYMSPEAATGIPGTIATDVWGLGSVLYSLLSGHGPHQGSELAAVIRSAAENPVTPPSRCLSPGWHRPPADLEAICLKALSREPRRRYPSAIAFAEDLEAWLAGRPVSARPLTWPVRTWLWARRKPAAAAAVLLLVSAAGTIAWTRWQSGKRLAASLEESRRLLHYMTTTMAEKLQPLGQLALLEDSDRQAERYFTAVPAEDQNDAFLLTRSAFLAHRADLLIQLGKPEAAATARAAAADAGRASAAGPSSSLAAATAHRLLCTALRISGDTPGARAAGTVAAQKLASAGHGSGTAMEAIEVNIERGACEHEAGMYEAALGFYDAALAELKAADASDIAFRRRQWTALLGRCHALREMKLPEQALTAVQEGRTLLEALLAEAPAQFRLMGELGAACNIEASLLHQLNRKKEAEAAWRQQRQHLSSAAAADPGNPLWKHEQAMNAWALAGVSPDGEELELLRAEQLFSELHAAAPAQASWLRNRILFLRHSANFWQGRNQPQRETGCLQQGMESCRALTALSPGDAGPALWLEEFQDKYGGQLARSGDEAAAIAFCRTLLPESLSAVPETLSGLCSGSLGALRLAEWHLTRREPADAARFATACLNWRRRLLTLHGTNPEVHERTAAAVFLMLRTSPPGSNALELLIPPAVVTEACLPPWLRAAARYSRAIPDAAARREFAATILTRLLPAGTEPPEESAKYVSELRSAAR